MEKGLSKSEIDKEKELTPLQRTKSGILFALVLYVFILMIQVIEKASMTLAPKLGDFFFSGMDPVKAIATGWFTTSIVQSSGTVASVVAALAGNHILPMETVVFIIIGASLGTTITALLISVITSSKHEKDFRHGFEIGLSYTLYSAILILIVFVLEFFFGFFSKTSVFLASAIAGKVSLQGFPNLVGFVTDPVVKILFARFNDLFLLIFGFLALIFALRFMSRSVIGLLGGEKKARAIINKGFESKFRAYVLGALLTGVLFSSSITISLLVPLAASRLLTLNKAIPFVLGADIGTASEVLLAAAVLGNVNALATFIAFLLFGVIGGIIFLPNTEFLWRLTKYVSKKAINISRKKALYFLLAFILIPLLIMIIF